MNEQKREIENIRNAHLTVVPTLPALKTLHEKYLQGLNQVGRGLAVCKVSDKSEMVGEIIGWFDMELPHDKMTSITYTSFRCLMKHKYIIDRKSKQFVDDHIHIRGNFREY